MPTDTMTNDHKPNADTAAKSPDHKLPENSKANLDEKLDNAVDETFPGSDPVSIKITK